MMPVIHNLYLLCGSDVSKDLETQREVVVSMLLRLINYNEVWFFLDNISLALHFGLSSKSVHWYGNVLKRVVGHVFRRALEFYVDGHRRTWKKQVE